MPSDDFKSTRTRLSDWRVEPPADPDLAEKVLQQIRAESSPPAFVGSPLASWFAELGRHPVYAGAIALVLVLTGVTLAVFTDQIRGASHRVVPPEEYRIAIDPLYRLTESISPRATADQRNKNTVGDSLAWLRDELKLTDQQFHKLASLHEEFTPTFANIFHDLQLQKAEFEEFETKRRESELIDFIQVYRVTTNYRHLQDRATTSTAELVARVSQLVDAQQRSRYLELLNISPKQSTYVDEASPRHV